MIDYEKLKLAHELAEKYTKNTDISVVITFNMYFGEAVDCGHAIYFGKKEPNENEKGLSTDDLIAKLIELTQTKPKYKVDDQVWFFRSRDIETSIIEKVICDLHGIRYLVHEGKTCLQEKSLHPSKLNLIEAQIAHWTSLKNEEISTGSEDMSMKPSFEGEINDFNPDGYCLVSGINLDKCQHESDMPACHDVLKCRKCGVFYR